MHAAQILLVLLGASLALADFHEGGDYCTDEKDRLGTCKSLVSHDDCECSHESKSHEVTGGPSSGHSSGSGAGEWKKGEYCFLLHVFLNYSVILDADLELVFVEWINKTQEEIVENGNLTEYEQLVEIWYSLSLFFSEYYEIEIKIKYLYIIDWGYICELEGLAIDIQSFSTEVSTSECIEGGSSSPLIVALDDCKKNVSSSSDQTAIQGLIDKITIIIEGSLSFSLKLAEIYSEFSSFFTANPSLVSVIKGGKIEGFGIIFSYFDICATYWRIENFQLAAGGGSNSSLVEALNELWQNTSYTTSDRNNYKELYKKMLNYSSTHEDGKDCVAYFVKQLYSELILTKWEINAYYNVYIKGYGTIYQLIYAYIYCENNGVGSGEFTTETTKSTTASSTTKSSTSSSTSTSTSSSTKSSTSSSTSTSTSSSTSTSTSTTTKPTTTSTTTKAATTTTPSGNCATVKSVNIVTANITILLSSIDTAKASWTNSTRNQFVGYEKRIYGYSTNTTMMTDVQIFNSIKTVFTGFATSNTALYTACMAVYITGWGTIAQYCNCTVTS